MDEEPLEDNTDVVPARKLNKILMRLRFRHRSEAPWALFLRMTLKFSIKFSAEEVKEHEVQVIQRLSAIAQG